MLDQQKMLGRTAETKRNGRTGNSASFAFRTFATVLLAGYSTSAALAATCGTAGLGGGAGGPPSISATEASTTQVLEEIRRRTELAQQQQQPILVADASAGSQAAASTSGGGGTAAAAKPVTASGAPSKPKPVKKAAAAPAEEPAYYGEAPASSNRVMASWAQGYLDYEHHDNIAPGSQENRSRTSHTYGIMSGTDWTWVNGARAVQFGVFSGYNDTYNRFSNTNFDAYSGQSTESNNFDRTNNKQEIDGSFLGAYVAAVDGNTTFDLAFKADIFDLKQSSLLRQTNDTCGGDDPTAIESGSASVNNYTLAGNVSHKYALSGNSWLEPTAGFRYTITEYGSDLTTLTSISNNPLSNTFGPPGRLGLEDGTVLRLQAGLRAGQQQALPDGGLWTLVGGAFLYSDVLITGFDYNPAVTNNVNILEGSPVFPVDEGKLRVMGQFISTVDYANGWSYLISGEVRGGEDLFGIGSRIGARYQW